MLVQQELKSSAASSGSSFSEPSTRSSGGGGGGSNGCGSSHQHHQNQQTKNPSAQNQSIKPRPNPSISQNYNLKETNLSGKISTSLRNNSFDTDLPPNKTSISKQSSMPTHNMNRPQGGSNNLQQQQRVNPVGFQSNNELGQKLKAPNEMIHRTFNGNNGQYGAPMPIEHPNRPSSASSFGNYILLNILEINE